MQIMLQCSFTISYCISSGQHFWEARWEVHVIQSTVNICCSWKCTSAAQHTGVSYSSKITILEGLRYQIMELANGTAPDNFRQSYTSKKHGAVIISVVTSAHITTWAAYHTTFLKIKEKNWFCSVPHFKTLHWYMPRIRKWMCSDGTTTLEKYAINLRKPTAAHPCNDYFIDILGKWRTDSSK